MMIAIGIALKPYSGPPEEPMPETARITEEEIVRITEEEEIRVVEDEE